MRRVLGLAIATALLAGCGNTDEDDYVQKNKEILRDIPSYPGTKQVAEDSSPYYDQDAPEAFAGIAGYTTRWEYALPSDATRRKVGDFYKRELPGWQLKERVGLCPRRRHMSKAGRGAVAISCHRYPTVFNFKRDQASLSVNLDNAPYGKFEVTVDHNSYGNR